ncbi:hypothetical protein BJX70DRAFT_397202 [Aspergillus crustosus]
MPHKQHRNPPSPLSLPPLQLSPAEPSPIHSPAPQSPLTTRKTLKSHPSTSGPMAIEAYLAALDPYRTSSNPWPYPWVTVPAARAVRERVEGLREQILGVLEKYGFPSKQYLRMTVVDVEKRGYSGTRRRTRTSGTAACNPNSNSTTSQSARPRPTPEKKTTLRLQCITNTALSTCPATPELLTPARQALDSLLATAGLKTLSTEIVFVNQSFDPVIKRPRPASRSSSCSSSPFSASPTVPESYTDNPTKRALADILVHHLGGGNGAKWSDVDMLFLGETVEDIGLVLGVCVEPYTRGDWSVLREEILECLRKARSDAALVSVSASALALDANNGEVKNGNGNGQKKEEEKEMDFEIEIDVEFFPGRKLYEFGFERKWVFPGYRLDGVFGLERHFGTDEDEDTDQNHALDTDSDKDSDKTQDQHHDTAKKEKEGEGKDEKGVGKYNWRGDISDCDDGDSDVSQVGDGKDLEETHFFDAFDTLERDQVSDGKGDISNSD